MGLLDAPGLSKQQATALFLTRARSLATSFLDPSATLPALSTDQPTVTWGTARTLASFVGPASPQISYLGYRGTYDTSTSRQAVGGIYSALDFFLTGQNLEIACIETTANGSRLLVYIDGKPMTATEQLGLTTTAGGIFFLKLAWGASARRRITVHATGITSWSSLSTDVGSAISPAPPMPRVALVGDSFFGGSAGSTQLQACGFDLQRLLGIDTYIDGYGGTGYVATGTSGLAFGNTSRTSKVIAYKPDLIVVSGSVNDGASAGQQAAAAALFSTYATALPSTPLIVFGPQPSNAVDTISLTRAQSIAAIAAAAAAAPNVLAFRDMVGTSAGTVPTTWSSSMTATANQLVTYKGSIYRWVGAAGSTGPLAPGAQASWLLQTYVYTGTGTSGALASDGNRDTFLYSDGIHPIPAGALALADRQAAEIRGLLLVA